MKKVYLDNSATTFPKPKTVIETMVDFMSNIGCNPGRGGYGKSLESGRLVYETRELINSFFNGPGNENVIFTQNITSSLNTVIKGMFKEGWHIITTSMEHNSVIRPLRRLEAERGISITVVKCKSDGTLDPEDIKKAITKDTKAVVMTHASNLTGTIMPVYDVGRICRDYGLYFILDSAQTAGILDIDYKDMNLDVLAFTGHKGLMGPQGIGGFLISERADKITSPLIEGGTGSRSHMETQPEILPDKYESGTLNTVGIAGLKAGIEYIESVGLHNIRLHEKRLFDMLLNGLSEIKGMEVFGPCDSSRQVGVLPINIKGMDPAELSFVLDSEYGIMTRTGLHCTPLAHKTIGTYPRGAVRLSIGYFNSKEDIEYTLEALTKISKIQD
jgi:cysteine desulfurase family protein